MQLTKQAQRVHDQWKAALKAEILTEAGFPALLETAQDALERIDAHITWGYSPEKAAEILEQYEPLRQAIAQAEATQ